MDDGGGSLATIGVLMTLVGGLAVRRIRRKPLQLLGITLMSMKAARWTLGLGILALVLAVAGSGDPDEPPPRSSESAGR